MLNLMKYELLRRRKLLITIFVVLVFLEASIIVGLLFGEGWYIMALLSFILMFVCAIAFPFLDTVINYFSDFKKKNGHMLFLTPTSGYKILGAKVLFLLCELLAIIILVGSFVAVNIDIANQYSDIVINVEQILNNSLLTTQSLISIVGLSIVQYLTNAMIAIFSITIAKTLLSNKDFNWLLGLLFYFAIYTVIQMINGGVLLSFGIIKDTSNLVEMENKNLIMFIKYMFVGYGLFTIVFSSLFAASGRLLNKRTDL